MVVVPAAPAGVVVGAAETVVEGSGTATTVVAVDDVDGVAAA